MVAAIDCADIGMVSMCWKAGWRPLLLVTSAGRPLQSGVQASIMASTRPCSADSKLDRQPACATVRCDNSHTVHTLSHFNELKKPTPYQPTVTRGTSRGYRL